MNRKSNWLDESITWRGYLTLCGICTLITTIVAAVEYIVFLKPTWWMTTKNFMKGLFDR